MANRYWVGGNSFWNTTAGTKWALTSGGAGGQAVPTTADDVFFDAASGASTITIQANNGAKSINCTGFTGTFTGTSTQTVAGSLTFSTGMTQSFTGTWSLTGTGTLTSAGKLMTTVTITGAGITVTLADAMSAATLTLSQGTLDLAGFTATASTQFSSNNSNTRSIAFGSGNIALTSFTASTTVLSMATATGFTWTGTGGFTRPMVATATVTFGTTGGSATNAPNLSVTSTGSSALTITTNSWFNNLIYSAVTGATTGANISIAGDLTLAVGGTYTALSPVFVGSSTSTATSNGRSLGAVTLNSVGKTLTLADAMSTPSTSAFTLTAGTVDLNGFTLTAGSFSSDNTNVRSIAFGSANIVLNSATAAVVAIDMANATNFTWTGTGGFTRSAGSTTTFTFGATGGTASNAVNLSLTGGSSTLTFASGSDFNNLNFTGNSSAVLGLAGIYGDLTLATGGTYTSFTATYFDSGTITSNGKTLSLFQVNGAGITVTCADALRVAGALNFAQGTLNLKNGVTSTVGSFVTLGTTLKYLGSSTPGSQATISDSSGTTTATYLSIQDSNATGGAVWNAFLTDNNVDAGNNSGWIFGASGGSFLMFF